MRPAAAAPPPSPHFLEGDAMFSISRRSRGHDRSAGRGRCPSVAPELLEGRIHLAAHIGAMTYPTIQAAVTAALPGQTITVDPGVYNESVIVDKPMITIDGAQAGVDARLRS